MVGGFDLFVPQGPRAVALAAAAVVAGTTGHRAQHRAGQGSELSVTISERLEESRGGGGEGRISRAEKRRKSKGVYSRDG